jgi:3-oxoacyl-[acyl-carrier protein] reductase
LPPPARWDPVPTWALHVVKGRPAAEEIVHQIQQQGGRAIAVPGDLALPETAPALFDPVEAAFGPVDVLVNNAVHCEDPDTIFTTSAGSLDRYFAVNIRGTVMLIREFVQRYRQRQGWGRIINLSTDAAQRFAGQIVYGATKATIEAFTRSIAIETGPIGLRSIRLPRPGTDWLDDGRYGKTHRAGYSSAPGRLSAGYRGCDRLPGSDQARWLTGQVVKVSGDMNCDLPPLSTSFPFPPSPIISWRTLL